MALISVGFIFLFIVAPKAHVWLTVNGNDVDIDGLMSVDELRSFLLLALLMMVIITVIIFVLSGVFRRIARAGTPFTTRISKDIRLIAILLLVLALVLPLANLLFYLLPWFNGVDFGFFPDPFTLLIAAIFFCLALIFDYGTQLQLEADETL